MGPDERRQARVSPVSAAQQAATMNLLCVHETGTITMNQPAVTGVMTTGWRIPAAAA
jgi:H+-transporting ATPase